MIRKMGPPNGSDIHFELVNSETMNADVPEAVSDTPFVTMEMIRAAHAAVHDRATGPIEVGIVLGTGLGGLAAEIDVDVEVPYGEIPHMPTPTVESHAGRLLIGTLGGRRVIAMQGRFHRYEGYSLQQVTLPIRVFGLLGVETLIVSAACGGMHPLWKPGEIVLLDDHINLLADSPLIGPNLDELGPRFPDMSEPYDRELQAVAVRVAMDLRIPLHRGVYVAVAGPALETRAEYRMLRLLGADVVGMSTVPEVLVARHMGMRVLGAAIITDTCLPDALEPVSVERIIATAAKAEPDLTRLIAGVIDRLPETETV